MFENVSRETLAKWLMIEEDYLDEFCQKNRLSLSPEQKSTLMIYAKWLWETNQDINLVSRKDEINILRKHICHSFSIPIYHPDWQPKHVIDIGTGGGIPGVPLSVLYPKTSFYLVDSIQKKIDSLSTLKFTQPEFGNIYPLRDRMESIKTGNIIRADAVVTRGVAPMHEIIEWTKHIWKGKTRFQFYFLKGGDLEKEFADIPMRVKNSLLNIQVQPIQHFGATFIGEEKFVIQLVLK